MTARRRGTTALLGCSGVLLLLVAAAFGFGYAMSDATVYCPWQHRFNDLSSCEVLDSAGGRVLLQHADQDSNIYYLEIITQHGARAHFELPRSIGRLAPGGYTAKLVPSSETQILLNGQPVDLHQLR